MREVVEGAKDLVDVTHSLITDMIHDILVIAEGKVVVQGHDIAIEALPQVDHNVFLSSLDVFDDHLGLRQVDIEVIETVHKLSDATLHRSLFMEEFDQRVCL